MSIVCPKCKKELTPSDEERDFFFCEYCGEKIVLKKEEPQEEELSEAEETAGRSRKVFLLLTIFSMAIGVLGSIFSGNKSFYLVTGLGIVIGELGLLTQGRKKAQGGARFGGWREQVFDYLKEEEKKRIKKQ